MVSRLPYLNINSMKRKITLLLFFILTVSVCFAQSYDDRWRKKYINLGFINTTMSQDGLPDLKSNYGASFFVGGASISSGVIGLGIETCFGNSKYEELGQVARRKIYFSTRPNITVGKLI